MNFLIRKVITELIIMKDRTKVSYKEYGILHILKVIFAQIIKLIIEFQNFKIFVKDILKDNKEDFRANGVRLMVFSNISELTQNLKGELAVMNPVKLARQRFEYGQFCAIAEDRQGNQISSFWFTCGRQNILGNDEAYFYNAYTLPQYRGRDFYPNTLKLLSAYLAKKDFNKLYCIILPSWVASIRGVIKAGFRYSGNLRYIKFFMCNKLILKI